MSHNDTFKDEYEAKVQTAQRNPIREIAKGIRDSMTVVLIAFLLLASVSFAGNAKLDKSEKVILDTKNAPGLGSTVLIQDDVSKDVVAYTQYTSEDKVALKNASIGAYATQISNKNSQKIMDTKVANKIDVVTNTMLDCGLSTCNYIRDTNFSTNQILSSDFIRGLSDSPNCVAGEPYFLDYRNVTKTRPTYMTVLLNHTIEANGTNASQTVFYNSTIQNSTENYTELEAFQNTEIDGKKVKVGNNFRVIVPFTKTNWKQGCEIYDVVLGVERKEAAWWNTSYANRFPINCTNVDAGTVVLINGSNGFSINGETAQFAWTTCYPSTYLYYNNNSDYVVANDTLQMNTDVDTGLGTSLNAQTMWRMSGAVLVNHMNENATLVDSAGYNDQTRIGTTCYSQNTYRKIGNAAINNGACYWNKNATAGLPTGNNPSTEMFWAYPNSTSTISAMSYGESTTDKDRNMQWNGGGTGFVTYGQYGANNIQYDAKASTLSWHFYTSRYNGTDIWVSVNRTENSTVAGQTTNTGSARIFMVGFPVVGNWAGAMDEARIYNSTLNDSVLNQIYLNVLNTAGYGTLGASEANTPANTAPTITAISVVPASPTEASTLSCNFTATDPEQTLLNVTIGEWYKNGVNQTTLAFTLNNTANNTAILASNLTASNFAKGENWSCRIQIYDGTDYSTTNMSANVTIANSLPVNATVGSYSDATAGHWFLVNGSVADLDNASDIITTNISVSAGSCSQKSNSTSGNTFSVQYNCTSTSPASVTPVIGFTDASSAYVQATGAAHSYPNINPTIAVTSVTATLYVNDTATCTNGAFSDLDGDTENISARAFNWYKNGTMVNGTLSTLLLSSVSAAKGDNISCSENATNTTWSGIATNSSSNVTILNSIPFIKNQISFVNGSVHTVLISATATDMDGGNDITSTNYTISNGACGTSSSGTNGNDYSLSWNCSATSPSTASVVFGFTDSSGAYVATAEANNTYLNVAPAITAPSVSSPLYVSSTATCTAGAFSDADGDTEDVSARVFNWYKNGVMVAGTSSTLALSSVSAIKSDNISCSENATNTTWSGIATNLSSNVTISNSAPSISVQNTFTNASVGHWFTVVGGVTDADGGSDIIGSNITATLGTCSKSSNSTAGTGFNQTFNCTSASSGSSSITIGFTDGSAAYIATTASANSYPNNAPSLAAPSISPTNPNTTSNLTATNGVFSDNDSDTENVSARAWQWYNQSGAIAGATSSTLANTNFVYRDTITAEECATNSTWAGTACANSSSVTIANIPPTATMTSPSANLTTTNVTTLVSYQVNTTANTTILLYLNGAVAQNDTYNTTSLISANFSYNISHGYGTHNLYVYAYHTANLTLNATSETITITSNPIANTTLTDGYLGYDPNSILSNSDIDALISTYGYNLIGYQLNYSSFNSTYPSLKTAINRTFALHNYQSFVKFYFTSSNYSIHTSECSDINANLTDFQSYPYTDGTAFFVIDLNDSTTVGNKSDFINSVAACILTATNNRFNVYSTNSTGLNTIYANPWTMLRLNSSGNPQTDSDTERQFLRNSTSLTRIYNGSSAAFKSWSSNYYQTILRNLRAAPSGNSSVSDPNVAEIANGDVVLFNTGNASASINSNLTKYGNNDAWDITQKNLYRNVSTSANTTITNITANSASILLFDNYSKFFSTSNTTSTLYKGVTNAVGQQNYYSTGVADGTYSIQGAADARAELWDSSFGFSSLEFHTYEILSYAQIINFSPYSIIVIAGGSNNTPANVNTTLNPTVNVGILNKTYGYTSVADYSNLNASGDNETDCSIVNSWETNKTNEILNWTRNYTTNVFIDGFDIGYSITPGCFEQRVKRLGDTVRAEGKKSLFNTYTIYQTVAHYGDGIMRESCFSRWDGTTSSPTYSYENFTLMIQNAQFINTVGKPVVCMAFGDANDYDKMMFDYYAFAVMYGTGNNNTFRYAQPNFQTQREIRVPNFGTPLQKTWDNTTANDWTRRYSNGVIHFNPLRDANYSNGKYYWFDNGETINSVSVTGEFQIYGSACSADHNLYMVVNDNASSQATIDECADVGATQWSSAYVTKTFTSDYTPNGHYYVRLLPASRAQATGMNIYNYVNTTEGIHSWYDNTANNPPSESQWTTYGRSGNWGDNLTTNWKFNVTVNRTTKSAVDDNVSSINTSITAYSGGIYNVTISSTTAYNLTFISFQQWVPSTSLVSIKVNNTSLNYTTNADCTGNNPTFNYSTVNGETHGVCRTNATGGYWYRFSSPHLSSWEYSISTNTPPSMNTSRIAPTTAYTTSSLLGYGNATDAEGDNVSYNYTFYQNGIAVQNGSFNNSTQGIERNIGNFTGTLAVGDNITLETMAYDGLNYSAKMNSSTITILNANYSSGTVTQVLATSNNPVQWYVPITINNGTGTCNYSILQSAVQNSTVIKDSLGNAVTNLGNYTIPSWNCTILSSPYNVTFYTESINQAADEVVSYSGVAGTDQKRILLSSKYMQNINLTFTYAAPSNAVAVRLYQCAAADNASCTSSGYNSLTFTLTGHTITKQFQLTSNETVLVASWDVATGGPGGGSTGAPIPLPPANNTTIFIQANQTQSNQTQVALTPPKPDFLAESWNNTKSWAQKETRIGNFSIGNYLIMVGLSIFGTIFGIYYYYNLKQARYLLLSFVFLFAAIFTVWQFGGMGA